MEYPVFFDTHHAVSYDEITPISIGCIDERGNTFYAEFRNTEFWIHSRSQQLSDVFNKLKFNFKESVNMCDKLTDTTDGNTIIQLGVYGDAYYIGEKLKSWLNDISLETDKITFVADIAHYDAMVLFPLLDVDEYVSNTEEPKKIIPAVLDLNQLIYNDINDYQNDRQLNMKRAIQTNRMSLITDKKPLSCERQYYVSPDALYNAKVVRAVYNSITNQ